jgi:uncharacterized membrane protein YebE (DUF533 family)
MTDDTENLVLEHLRAMRAILDQHTKEFADIKLRLSGMDQHMAGFLISEVRQNSELDELRARVVRLEKRLELADE